MPGHDSLRFGAPTAPATALPAYQVLAIDADTGAAGTVYSVKRNALCGSPGYQPAWVAPAVEFVSVPWTMVAHGPGLPVSHREGPATR